ncbi:MAG TPA: alpha/beta fold hydrolase [Thermoleophilaceae bacterium]|nr:alpha/beta fold hydrolase [Thermoleophilaceae bacterium]
MEAPDAGNDRRPLANQGILSLRDGRNLGFAVYGSEDSPPVLFFHGAPGGRLLPPVAGPLAEKLGIRIISFDRPGFGLSDFKPGRTVPDLADDVAELADQLELERFALLGISAGGPYLLACCAAMPERVVRAGTVCGLTPWDRAGIVTNSSPFPQPVRWAVRRSRAAARALHAGLVLGMRKSPERGLEGLASTLSTTDRKLVDRPEIAQFLRRSTLETARGGARGWVYDDWVLNHPWGFDPADVSPDVEIVLWAGSDDNVVPVPHVERLARELHGARVHVYEGEGHMGVIFDHTEEIFREVVAGARTG